MLTEEMHEPLPSVSGSELCVEHSRELCTDVLHLFHMPQLLGAVAVLMASLAYIGFTNLIWDREEES